MPIPHNKVLDETDIKAIRERYFGGRKRVKKLEVELRNLREYVKQSSIARDYGVSAPHINRILRNKARTAKGFEVVEIQKAKTMAYPAIKSGAVVNTIIKMNKLIAEIEDDIVFEKSLPDHAKLIRARDLLNALVVKLKS